MTSTRVKLVSPVAEHFGRPIEADRPAAPRPLSVLLIDGMLNPTSGWGQYLLDGVETVLSEGGERTYRRITRPDGVAHAPEEWARAQVGEIDLAVSVVGD